jgi:drug/metabolite transporter (DMT)-like permease
MTPAALAARDRVRVFFAFAAVYVLWGSTYLFIRFAVESIPPFYMGATRLLFAGILLYGFARFRGAAAPTMSELTAGLLSGVLMLGIGNGSVVWAVQVVPSGIVALIISGVPLWIVIADWVRPNGVRPRASVLAGVGIGLVGIAVLIGPRIFVGAGNVNPVGAVVLLLGSMSWAMGSLLTRHQPRPRSALVSIAIQMTVAGLAFTAATIATGELARVALTTVSARAIWSWLYLVVFGSLIGYTAYVYLLGKVSPAKAATYAYVNPVIAVVLGWAFAGEALSARTGVAAAITLAGVAIITSAQGRTQPYSAAPDGADGVLGRGYAADLPQIHEKSGA